MRSSRYALPAAILLLLPGVLLAQYRMDEARRGPHGGEYPFSPLSQARPVYDKPPYGITTRMSTVEEWANAMETGIRDPFKRAFSKQDDVRDVYLVQPRANREPPAPRYAEIELRTAIQRELELQRYFERSRQQENELRSLRSLYENRLRTVPSPGYDRR
jgi:hypothetical protein